MFMKLELASMDTKTEKNTMRKENQNEKGGRGETMTWNSKQM